MSPCPDFDSETFWWGSCFTKISNLWLVRSEDWKKRHALASDFDFRNTHRRTVETVDTWLWLCHLTSQIDIVSKESNQWLWAWFQHLRGHRSCPRPSLILGTFGKCTEMTRQCHSKHCWSLAREQSLDWSLTEWIEWVIVWLSGDLNQYGAFAFVAWFGNPLWCCPEFDVPSLFFSSDSLHGRSVLNALLVHLHWSPCCLLQKMIRRSWSPL